MFLVYDKVEKMSGGQDSVHETGKKNLERYVSSDANTQPTLSQF